MANIVLATESKYKKELFSRLNLSFTSMAAKIDETPLDQETAKALAQRLARQKATHIYDRLDQRCYVIGADQAAECGGQIIAKPMTHERACEDLRRYSGNTISFYTAVCCFFPDGSSTDLIDITKVSFRDLSESEIEQYLKKEQPYDCAGAFKSEGLGISLFESIESNDPAALIGLPLIQLATFFREQGFDLYKP